MIGVDGDNKYRKPMTMTLMGIMTSAALREQVEF